MSLFLIRAITWNHVVPPPWKNPMQPIPRTHHSWKHWTTTSDQWIMPAMSQRYKCQYKVLPFRQSLAPWVFSRSTQAALSPLITVTVLPPDSRPFRSLTASSHTSWSSVSQKRVLLWDWAPRSHNFFGIELDSVSIVAKLAPRSVAYITRYEYATIYNFCTCWGCWDC